MHLHSYKGFIIFYLPHFFFRQMLLVLLPPYDPYSVERCGIIHIQGIKKKKKKTLNKL